MACLTSHTPVPSRATRATPGSILLAIAAHVHALEPALRSGLQRQGFAQFGRELRSARADPRELCTPPERKLHHPRRYLNVTRE